MPIMQLAQPWVNFDNPVETYNKTIATNQLIDEQKIRNRILDMYLRDMENQDVAKKLQAAYMMSNPQPTTQQAPIDKNALMSQMNANLDLGAPIPSPNMPQEITSDRQTFTLQKPVNPNDIPDSLDISVPAPFISPEVSQRFPDIAIQLQQEYQDKRDARITKALDIATKFKAGELEKALPMLKQMMPDVPWDMYKADEFAGKSEVAFDGGKFVKGPDGLWHIVRESAGGDDAAIRGAFQEKYGRPPTNQEFLQAKIAFQSEMARDKSMAGVAAAIAKAIGTAQAQKEVWSGEAKSIGDQIIAGKLPPEIGRGMFKIAPQVYAYLADQGFNLVDAQLDWKGLIKRVQTANSAPFLRMENAILFTKSSIPTLKRLVAEWSVKDKNGVFVPLNKANMMLAKQGVYGQDAQGKAQRLDTQINDMVSELGTIYKGGNSATDDALKLAAENFKSEWSAQTMLDNADLIEENIGIREHSLNVIRHSNKYSTGKDINTQPPAPTIPKPTELKNVKQSIYSTKYKTKAALLQVMKADKRNSGQTEAALKSAIDKKYEGAW